MKTVYVCEICKEEYDDTDSAERCESRCSVCKTIMHDIDRIRAFNLVENFGCYPTMNVIREAIDGYDKRQQELQESKRQTP